VLTSFGSIQAQVGQNNGLLNPNLASVEELKKVPGLAEDLASDIKKNRPFLNILDLDKFLSSKLGEERRELYNHLFIPLNLNEASREEILLVPNLGNKMAHEFEEYRPYVKIAQFRREMAKYVNDAEIARLEQFVFVPIELNTASDEEIRSIPGVGDRMLHEFKEYRPYESMEQFHREIGKYVDDDELARLARYVYLKM
jgi:DNA uptake protein ComE-like DNA-binding protein